jgi:excisionase family DNA binding protein
MTQADSKEFCTTAEAARLLGVSHRTIQLWVEAGALQAWKTAGGHRRITIVSIERLLAQRAGELAPASDQPAAARRFKVLVVDDDPSLLRLYELELLGWNLPLEILKAHNGFDALLKIGEHAPDLLISDLNMPGMDGFRMISTLRADPARRDLRVIVVSGLDAGTIASLGLPADIPVFTKPVQFSRLQAAVEQLLQG